MKTKKSFKVAHIVPISCLEETANNQYHMCLAQLVKQSNEYAEFYKRMSAEGKYVLMDNGAAEGCQSSLDDFIRCCEFVKPTEIVLPDTLQKKNKTLRSTLLAYNYLQQKFSEEIPYKVMAVVQGKGIDKSLECIKQYRSLAENKMLRIDTLGIPKVLVTYTDDENARARLLELAASDIIALGCEVHLLGCNESTETIRKIHRYYGSDMSYLGFVRGIDSAFAYLGSQADVLIDEGAKRPKGSIDFLRGKSYKTLANNMDGFNEAVGVADNEVDSFWLEKKRR